MNVKIPTIGRMVHYVSFGTPGGEYAQACRAAIVTACGAWVDLSIDPEEIPYEGAQPHRRLWQMWEPSSLALTVENPTGTFKDQRIHWDPGTDWSSPNGPDGQPLHPRPDLCTGLVHRGGSWHWPVLQ